jgi:hypothetical protein
MGGSISLPIYGFTTGRYIALLKFDISARIPAGTTIDSAVLSLYDHTPAATGRTINCYRIRRGDWSAAQATWNTYKTGSNWGTAGAFSTTTDHDTTNSVSSTSPTTAGWQSWTITAQVQSALDSYSGIVHLRLNDPNSNQNVFNQYHASAYTTDLTLRPKLVITYTNKFKTVNGLAIASVKSKNGLLIASVKSIDGLT